MTRAFAARSLSPVIGLLAALALVAAALLVGAFSSAAHDQAGAIWNKKSAHQAGAIWNKKPVELAGVIWNKKVDPSGAIWN